MKKILFLLILFFLKLNYTFASDSWIFWPCLDEKKIKNWDFNIDHIPCVINYAINFFMWIAWTIAVIFIIIWAYQIMYWSFSWDKAKWKKTITLAISWFVLAAFSWLIIKFILDNFS